MRMKLLRCGAVLLLLTATQAVSRDKPDPKQQAEEAAREFVRNQLGGEALEDMYQQGAQAATLNFQVSIQPALKRALTDDEKNRLYLFWHEKMKGLMPPERFEDLLVPLVTKYLTGDEIQEINAFYATRTGMKVLQMQPSLAREARVAGQEFARKLADKDWQAAIVEDLKNQFPQFFPSGDSPQ